MGQISLSEIDKLIRDNIKNRGIEHLSEDKIAEIKNAIKTKLSDKMVAKQQHMAEQTLPGEEEENPEEPIMPSQPQEPSEPAPAPSSPGIEDNIGETQEIETKFISPPISVKGGEMEHSYTPQLPDFIEKAEPGKIFIHDMNELSLGSESLMNARFNSVDNPDQKITMHELWLDQGKVRAEVYKMEFKKIGELVFQPLNGMCRFNEISDAVPTEIPAEETDQVRAAMLSQEPTEPMLDSVEPVTDVTLEPSSDMGLNPADVQKAMQDVVEKALRSYLMNKGDI